MVRFSPSRPANSRVAGSRSPRASCPDRIRAQFAQQAGGRAATSESWMSVGRKSIQPYHTILDGSRVQLVIVLRFRFRPYANSPSPGVRTFRALSLPPSARRRKSRRRPCNSPRNSLPRLSATRRRLTFHVTPLSARGLLSQQIRDALKAVARDAGNETVLHIRAFAAGSRRSSPRPRPGQRVLHRTPPAAAFPQPDSIGRFTAGRRASGL